MIEIGNLSFAYQHAILFQDLNADFEPGRIYGILGKNGAGKTSLFKLICGLLRPLTGYCSVHNMNSQDRDPGMLQDLFFIPESYYLPPVSIKRYEDLHAPFYPSYDANAFRQYLKEMELQENQTLNTLSYGLSKRFLLAFGLATNARILLLDEPTNGLDIPSKRVFRKLLAGGINDNRLFLIATHQIRELENIFDHLVFIDHGRILLDSSVSDISTKLLFRTETSPDQLGTPLFQEQIPGGYAVIEKNRTGEESSVDLEFLFNAVMESGIDFHSLLHHEKGGENE